MTMAFSSATAQDANNPWVITLGANAVDAYPTNLPSSDLYGPQGKWFSQFFNTKEHWNILPAVTTLGVNRFLSDGFSIGGRLSLNEFTKSLVEK